MEEDFVAKNKEKEAEIAEQNRQLFQTLGITQEDISRFLQDPKRFSPEAWKLLQKRREELQTQIEAKIQEMNQTTNKKIKNPKGHWLFVK
jgi:hypothetical protein